MKSTQQLARLITIGLITLGVTGLVYQAYLYTQETYALLSGSTAWFVDNNRFFNTPVWTSIAMLLIGVVLLVGRSRNTVTATLAHRPGR